WSNALDQRRTRRRVPPVPESGPEARKSVGSPGWLRHADRRYRKCFRILPDLVPTDSPLQGSFRYGGGRPVGCPKTLVCDSWVSMSDSVYILRFQNSAHAIAPMKLTRSPTTPFSITASFGIASLPKMTRTEASHTTPGTFWGIIEQPPSW